MSRAAGLLEAARAGGYAIGAFNAVNLETAQAVVAAAEAECAPVILQFSENAARYAGIELLAAIGRTLRDAAGVPVVLHYDHAASPASARRALELGFDSVMLESAHLPLDEGVAQLAALAETARAEGRALEAEFEVVEKEGRSGGARHEAARLAELVEHSGCQLLAVEIGSRHKGVEKSARLDLERLASIAERVSLPLVLHGASGVVPDDLARAVSLGIAKVNVATELMIAFTEGVRARLEGAGGHDPRDYLGAGRERLTGRARAIVRELGSSGRAST